MGFATPWFLTGIVAIGLPVSIHLLAQNRSLPRQFSSLMFFEQRVQASVKYRRLRYLLLLALRVTLLVLMAIAFANPFVTPGGASASWGKLMVLAIDDSFSMRYGDHFSKAKDAALKTVFLLRPQDRAQAIALDSHVYFLTQQTADREQLRAAIRGMQVSDARSSYADLCHALCVLDKSAHQPLEVHFFTDAQRSSMPASFADLRLGDRTRLLVHAVGSGSEPNWTVESVTAPSRIYSSKSARVQAVVAGFNTPAVQKTVSLVVDGKVLESKQVSVPENGRAPVEFASLASPYGFHRGEVRIESHDPLPNDDRFPFAVERAELSPILFLHQARSTRDVLYFKTAIESVEEAGFVVRDRLRSSRPRVNRCRSTVLWSSPMSACCRVASKMNCVAMLARGGRC